MAGKEGIPYTLTPNRHLVPQVCGSHKRLQQKKTTSKSSKGTEGPLQNPLPGCQLQPSDCLVSITHPLVLVCLVFPGPWVLSGPASVWPSMNSSLPSIRPRSGHHPWLLVGPHTQRCTTPWPVWPHPLVTTPGQSVT